MKTIAFGLISIVALLFGFWPITQQNDLKAEVKKAGRDSRYSEPGENVTNIGNGHIRRSGVDFVDMEGYDQKTPEGKLSLSAEKRSAIRDKLEVEHTDKRKATICQADVIVFGKIKEVKGYITTDDTAIYSVYKIVVSEIYRDSQSVNLGIGNEVEFTMPGGVARTRDGKTVAVEHPNYSWLGPGMDHILFLKYEKKTDDYFAFDPLGIYKIMPEGRIIRGDAKHGFLARKAVIAKEPATLQAITSELRATTCK